MIDTSVWRVLDVNANRAAEGLRTIEDVARVIRQDAVAALWAKSLRHDLAAAISKIDRSQRLAARSAETDPGTGHTAEREMDRGDWKAIVTAACERVGQSLRCLEEFSKLIDEISGLNFKSLRYRAYDILAQLELRLLRDPSLQRAQIYLLVDCALPIDEFRESMRAFADAGVDLFQVRDKACDGRQLVQYARAAIESLSQSNARVIVNDRIDVALASGAAGVHLGQEDLTLQDARRMAGSQLWIGVSTHSLEQAVAAERAGADYIGCGPTFPSRTKSFSEFPGTRLISEIAATVSLPAFAIGGIDANNLGEAMAAGCRRVALSSAIHQSENPTSSVREMKRRLSIAGLCNGTDVTL